MVDAASSHPDVDHLVAERVAPLMEDRRRAIATTVLEIESDAAIRGLGRSSWHVRQIEAACEAEAVRRAQIAWIATKDVLAAIGVAFTDDLAARLTGLVMSHTHTGDLVEIVNRRGGQESAVRDAIASAQRRVRSDVDLYTLNLKRVSDQQGTGQPVLNFHGPVGAVQTGTSAVANVVQNIGTTERDLLLDALREVTRIVEASRSMEGRPREEVLELVEECRAELKRERPNRLRVSTVATGIGMTIQTMADGQGAYQLLKTALAAIGIALP